MNSPATAADWMAQFAEGSLSSAHRAAFVEWLRESPTHVRELLELSLLQEDLAGNEIAPAQMESWVREARSAGSEDVVDRRYFFQRVRRSAAAASAPRQRRIPALRLTAVLALVACLIGGYYMFSHGRYTTGFGEQRIVTLVDGSVVSLNTDSRLKVDYSAHRRRVRLISGEAFFRVAIDAARPFEVQARNATVRALGTSFNVKLAPTATLVSVIDGLVEVRGEGERADRVGEGEEARVTPSAPIVKTSNEAIQRASAWTRGRVEFDAVPLQEVLAEFQRYRRFEVHIDDPALRTLKLTGSFDTHDLESALEYLQTLPAVSVERESAAAFIIRRDETESAAGAQVAMPNSR